MLVNMAKFMTLGFAGLFLYAFLFDPDFNNMGSEEWLLAILIFGSLFINLLALNQKSGGEKVINIWPFIMFKRLALQEKKKIEELQKK